MPRPAEIPDWLYPGNQVRDKNRQMWRVESLQFRDLDGYHVFLKPLGRGISGWFPVETAIRAYGPNPSDYPEITRAELMEHAYAGDITIIAEGGSLYVIVQSHAEGPLQVGNTTLQPRSRTRFQCSDWNTGSDVFQIEDGHSMMVSFDGHRPMPYVVREIAVGEGHRLVLEAEDDTLVYNNQDEMEETHPLPPAPPPGSLDPPRELLRESMENTHDLLQAGMVSVSTAIQAFNLSLGDVARVLSDDLGITITPASGGQITISDCTFSGEALTPKPNPLPPPRRISRWEWIREQKKGGPSTISGGAETRHQALDTDNTPDEDVVE